MSEPVSPLTDPSDDRTAHDLTADDRTADAIDLVKQFLGRLEALDVDGAVDLLDESIVYQNVPLPAARGVRAVAKQLGFLARYGSGFEVHYDNVAASVAGSTVTVLTERTDVLVFGRLRAAFWVCGTFEVRDGRITLWRDRFDFVDFLLSFVRGGIRALLGGRGAN